VDGRADRTGARASFDRLGDHQHGVLPAQPNQITIIIEQRRIICSFNVLGAKRHAVPHVARNGSLAAPGSERPENGSEVRGVPLEPLNSLEPQLMQSTARHRKDG